MNERQSTNQNVLPSLILQTSSPSSFSPAVTPVKTVVKPTPSKSTVSWFNDESISDHINFSSTSTLLIKNDERKHLVPDNSHPGSKQHTGGNSNESCNSKRVSSSNSRYLTDDVSGFSIVKRGAPTENFRLLDPKETIEVSSFTQESHKTENTVDDFPNSPDLFAPSPLPCDVKDESEKMQSAEDESYAFTPQSKNSPLSKTTDTKVNSSNKDEIFFDRIVKSESKDRPNSIDSTIRDLFREQKENFNEKLENTSGNANGELAQYDTCLESKENLSPFEQHQQNANVTEIMGDSKFHGRNEAKSEADFTSSNLGKEQLNDAIQSSPTTEVVDKKTKPSPQKLVSRINVRRATRKSSRLSSRRMDTKESECKTTHEKAKNCKSDSANQVGLLF